MGEMEVPADALYGASTQRAVLNFPISGQPLPAALPPRPGAGQAGRGRDERRARPARRRTSRRDRGGRRRGRRRRPRRPVPDRHLPDRLGHLDQHEHERGRRPPRERPGSAAAQGPPQRRRQPLPVLERHDPDRAPAVGGDGDRGRAAAGPRARSTPRWRPRREEFWPVVKTGRTHLQDATPIRLGQEFRGLRRPGRGVDPAGAGRPGRAARRCRSAGPRSGPGSTPIRSTRCRACARLSALTGLAVRETDQPLPRPGDARRGDRRPRRASGRSR